ncbi:hypothetical protein Syun_008691 [Stephania yunnanensis]|uniref:Uncharacterized protein n=1 Tax=Stephania yunnanensis TaxID=152371 RepID=A0AAP0PND5_9MAGN
MKIKRSANSGASADDFVAKIADFATAKSFNQISTDFVDTGDQSATKDPVDLDSGIDYGVSECVVRFVKLNGKTLEYLFCFVIPFNSRIRINDIDNRVVKTVMELGGGKVRKQLGGCFEYYMGRRGTPLPDPRWWCPASFGGPFQPTVWTTMRVEVVVTPPLLFLSYCASTMPSPTTSLSPVAATVRPPPVISTALSIGGVWKAHRGICRPRLLSSIRRGLPAIYGLSDALWWRCYAGSLLYRIGFGGESPRIPVGISREAQDFLKRCFVRNSKSRWNSSRLLSHPFLKDHIPNAEQYMQYSMESN